MSTSGLNLKVAGVNRLATRFVGFFEVLERTGEVAYKLDLHETMRIHVLFHISLLKRYHSDGRAQPPHLVRTLMTSLNRRLSVSSTKGQSSVGVR